MCGNSLQVSVTLNMPARTVLIFDFGTKNIGVAIGQEVTGTAAPLPALKAQQGEPNWAQVSQVYAEWQPQLVIVGLPLNMDGTEQPMTSLAQRFANRLSGRYSVPVSTWDERLTTVDARAMLFELGGYKKLSKDKIDSVSACVIFTSWVERHQND